MLKRNLPILMIALAVMTTIVVTLAVTVATHRLPPTRPVLPFLKGEDEEPTEAIDLTEPVKKEE